MGRSTGPRARSSGFPSEYDQSTRRVAQARAKLRGPARQSPHIIDLTPEQRRKLPPLVASHLDRRYLAGIRSGTAGNTAGGVFMGGMMMGGGGGGGGGGVKRVIIRGP